MISLPAPFAWYLPPTSLKKKTTFANTMNTSDSSIRKTVLPTQLQRTKHSRNMFEIKRYSEADKEVWNVHVEQARNATFLLNRSYMDYHSDRFHDHSLMIFRNGKLYALLPANEAGDTFFSHQGLTYAGLLTTEHASAEDICQVFVAINTYLKQAGFRKCIYKPIPWIYQQQPAEEDLYALFKECHAQICARNIAAVIDMKHPPKWYNIRKHLNRKPDEHLSCPSRSYPARDAQIESIFPRQHQAVCCPIRNRQDVRRNRFIHQQESGPHAVHLRIRRRKAVACTRRIVSGSH